MASQSAKSRVQKRLNIAIPAVSQMMDACSCGVMLIKANWEITKKVKDGVTKIKCSSQLHSKWTYLCLKAIGLPSWRTQAFTLRC